MPMTPAEAAARAQYLQEERITCYFAIGALILMAPVVMLKIGVKGWLAGIRQMLANARYVKSEEARLRQAPTMEPANTRMPPLRRRPAHAQKR